MLKLARGGAKERLAPLGEHEMALAFLTSFLFLPLFLRGDVYPMYVCMTDVIQYHDCMNPCSDHKMPRSELQ